MSNLYVYLMCSRNKDNKDIPNFKQRDKTILGYKENEEKIREEFIIRLLRDKPSMTQLNRTLASVVQQVQNRDESKWLFDFDVDDEKLAMNFCCDVHSCSYIPERYIEIYKTPHGYTIIVPHGFDTRELMEKWKGYDITLKKDELLFLDMITNE